MSQNTQDVIDKRRADVARLYLRGITQAEIALELNVTQGCISQDMEANRELWRTSTVVDFNEQKIETLRKIDNLEAQCWTSFFESMKRKRKTSTKRRIAVGKDATGNATDEPEYIERYSYREERDPDPRWLMLVDKQIERRCKILGLEAPLKIADTDVEGKLIQARRVWVIQDHTNGTPPPAPDDI